MRVSRGAIAIATIAAACMAGWLAGSANGAGEPAFGCKGVHTAEATTNPNPNGPPPILIGDSTVLLPIPNLNEVGISVNGRGCRGFRESIDVAAKLKRKHRLPHLILMNGYANGGANTKLIAQAVSMLGKSHVLGLLTEYNADTGHPPAPDTGILFKAHKQYPHRIFVMDWVKYSLAHHKAEPKAGAWFLPDLFHPNFTGADAYAQFLATALRYAPNGRFP
jgi:hypothetical protein